MTDERMGDWIKLPDEDGGGWGRDRITTGPHQLGSLTQFKSGEPVRLTFRLDPPEAPGWRAHLEHQLIGGAIQLAELRWERLTPEADPAPIYKTVGGRTLEQQIARELRQEMIWKLLPPEWWEASLQKRRTGRQPVTHLELAQIAERYLQAWKDDPLRPMATLVEREHRSINTLQGLLRTAVKRGIFTRAGRGKAGGALTDEGRALLAETGDDYGKR